MESAFEGMITAIHRNESDPPSTVSDDQIVVVRPEVVDGIGHVLGNLFQRLYHLIDQIGSNESATAQLHSATHQLEDYLQLVMDYFSPLSLNLQCISGADIAQSLASQISDRTRSVVKIGATIPLEGRLLVDPSRLARAFGLLAAQLVAMRDAAPPSLRVVVRPVGGALHFVVSISRALLASPSSIADTQWAVAEKLIVMHGGTLDQRPVSAGEVSWEIALPLQS